MGLLNSSLQIGRSAILGYEAALQVVGNNISSAGSADYTRLSPALNGLQGPLITGDLQPGAGVALSAIQRNIDEALEDRIRFSIGSEASATSRQSALAQIEVLFDDIGGAGLSGRLTEFFNGFEELQTTAEDPAIRDLVISSGGLLAESLRQLRTQLTDFSNAVNSQIGGLVISADQIAQDIARLNQEITTTEAGRAGQATALRDQRDGLLRQLSTLFDVAVREQPNGTVNVYIGNEALVQGNVVRGLVTEDDLDGDLIRTSVRFADTNQQISIRGGQLEGLIAGRDQHAQIEQVDKLAAALIADVNQIHANGQGTAGFTSVTGSVDLLANDVALDSAASGLAFPPGRGSFFITVADDATSTPRAFRIDVAADGTDAGTTLASLVADINANVAGVTASVTSDNRLSFVADAGLSFSFGYDGQSAREDTSGVLAALGINTFFTGTSAKDIGINDMLEGDPSMLAAASVFISGESGTAQRIAALASESSRTLDTVSLHQFYGSIANSVAIAAASSRSDAQAAESVLDSLNAQRESISGVSLDEEAIALVKYETAFQGAARFVRVVDDLLNELVQLIR